MCERKLDCLSNRACVSYARKKIWEISQRPENSDPMGQVLWHIVERPDTAEEGPRGYGPLIHILIRNHSPGLVRPARA